MKPIIIFVQMKALLEILFFSVFRGVEADWDKIPTVNIFLLLLMFDHKFFDSGVAPEMSR